MLKKLALITVAVSGLVVNMNSLSGKPASLSTQAINFAKIKFRSTNENHAKLLQAISLLDSDTIYWLSEYMNIKKWVDYVEKNQTAKNQLLKALTNLDEQYTESESRDKNFQRVQDTVFYLAKFDRLSKHLMANMLPITSSLKVKFMNS